jgi:hypothetical protein
VEEDHDHDHSHEHGDDEHDDHGHGKGSSAQAAAHCNELNLDEYDLSLHIASVFIQLGVSFLGAALPIGLKKWNARVPEYGYSLFKHFGSGIILSTG